MGQRQQRAADRGRKPELRQKRHRLGSLVRGGADALSPPDRSGAHFHLYQHWREDIALLKQLRHNTFRTSIARSRLIPDGRGAVNPEAVTFYNQIIDEMLRRDYSFINLFHFDMPMTMQQAGGWESRDVVEAYAEYAQTCFRLFGDRVKHWFTFNEPIVPVEGGYLYDFHYPNVVDFQRAATVARHTMLAHALAVRRFREGGYGGEIGIILNLTPSYPRSTHPADEKAARIADLFFNRSFLDPALLGRYPAELVALLKEHQQLPVCQRRRGAAGGGARRPARRQLLSAATGEMPRFADQSAQPLYAGMVFDHYAMPGRKMNPYRGWEIYEKGIYDILSDLRENYGNPRCFISENGMGVEDEQRFARDGRIEDDYRIEFVRDHLIWLHRALQEGSRCTGYHMWTFIDNWSWSNAYKTATVLCSSILTVSSAA